MGKLDKSPTGPTHPSLVVTPSNDERARDLTADDIDELLLQALSAKTLSTFSRDPDEPEWVEF